MGDDVAAWLLSYGAVSEAVIATATLPLPHSTPPRRAGEGAPGGGHYKRRYGPRGHCGAGAAAPRVGYGSDRRIASRAAPRLRRHLRCGPGGSRGGQRAVAEVREVELVLLHRGRAMDFAAGLSPFQDGIAAAGAVGGRGGGRWSELGVDAAGPPREAAGGGRAVDLGPSMILFFFHAGAWFPPFARTRAAPGRRQPPALCSTGCGAPVRGQCRRSRPAPWRCWGQQRARELSGLFGRSRRAADEASIWGPSGSITTAESRPLTLARLAGVRRVVGAWMGASGLRRETARRLPRPAPPGIFSRWGHVTRPHNIIGWLFRPLCVTIAYGLRMSRLGVSEECCIAHNVHLCPDLAKAQCQCAMWC